MISPMLCEPCEKIFDSPDYSFEVKYDGERAVLFIANGKLIIQNRRGVDISYRYPELSHIPNGKTATLDGEICLFDEQGRSDFDLLAQRSHLQKKFDIELRSQRMPVTFMAFDILSLEGQDLTKLPLIERREILYREFKTMPRFTIALPLIGSGLDLWEIVKQHNLEGLVAKHLQSPYLERRSPYWKKIKYEKTTDVTVTGYTVNNAGIRVHNDTGFGCQVTGFQHQAVKQRIDTQGHAVIEVKFLNLTKNNKLRMPTFKGLKG